MRRFLVLIVVITAPVITNAETIFVATIDGDSVNPPRNLPGTGTAVFVLNDEQTQLSFTITVQDLTSDETDAHVHNAGPRDRGPVVFELPVGANKVGVWDIPSNMVAELFANRLYVNIHTVNYVNGEIRGNITQQLPTAHTTWGAIKSLYD